MPVTNNNMYFQREIKKIRRKIKVEFIFDIILAIMGIPVVLIPIAVGYVLRPLFTTEGVISFIKPIFCDRDYLSKVFPHRGMDQANIFLDVFLRLFLLLTWFIIVGWIGFGVHKSGMFFYRCCEDIVSHVLHNYPKHLSRGHPLRNEIMDLVNQWNERYPNSPNNIAMSTLFADEDFRQLGAKLDELEQLAVHQHSC